MAKKSICSHKFIRASKSCREIFTHRLNSWLHNHSVNFCKSPRALFRDPRSRFIDIFSGTRRNPLLFRAGGKFLWIDKVTSSSHAPDQRPKLNNFWKNSLIARISFWNQLKVSVASCTASWKSSSVPTVCFQTPVICCIASAMPA